MSYTPGPWKYDGKVFIFGPSGEMIAEVRGAGADLPIDANGHVLGASTDLLKACEALVILKDHRSIDQAHAAIAKARGRDKDPKAITPEHLAICERAIRLLNNCVEPDGRANHEAIDAAIADLEYVTRSKGERDDN